MTSGDPLQRIAASLQKHNSIAIALPQQATKDAVAAALALYYALKEMGKNVSIASSSSMDPDMQLDGQEVIGNSISADGDTLVISLPYAQGGVENIKSRVINDRLEIHITPEGEHERVSKGDVDFGYTGGSADAIVCIYAPTFNSLGSLYQDNLNMFNSAEVINIDRHFTNEDYGTINYVDKKSPSMAQMINELFKIMKTQMTPQITTNLYDGLVAATNNFTAHSVNADTFRMAAFLLDHGAVKKPQFGTMRPPMNKPPRSHNVFEPKQPAEQPEPPKQESKQLKAPTKQENPQPKFQEKGDKQQQGTQEQKEQRGDIPEASKERISTGNPEMEEPSMQETLKPQIFKGGGLNKG